MREPTMFDFIRSHQRLMQAILLILIVPSFVFFGIQGYERMSQRAQDVAKVGGQSITQGELDDAQRRQIERVREQTGGRIDVAMLDTPEMRAQTLEQLIAQRVLTQQAGRQSLVVSDRQLRETILAMPGLQVAGRFDNDRYQAALAQQSMTPLLFESRLRQDLAVQQLGNAVEQSAVAPRSVVDRLEALASQRRSVAQATFKTSEFASRVELPADAVQKDYDAHPEAYVIPESLKVEYVSLNADALAKQATVTDDDVRKTYDDSRKKYVVPEERRASHILVAAAKDASDADRAKAKAKAEGILAKLRTNPGDFAKFAKENSDDPGSATNGGDLGFAGRGAFVPPFEAALFEQKKDEIGPLVQSDFGFHIIKVTDIKPEQVKSFDTVKGEIRDDLVRQAAAKKFTETAESFANAVYEQGDSLAPAAKTFGLPVQTADNVTKTPSPTLAPSSPLANGKLLAALFSAESMKSRHNTEAIETSPGTLVSARVVDVRPSSKKPLDEVAAGIRGRLVAAEARKLAEAAGRKALGELEAGKPDAAAFGPARPVARLERSDLPREAVEAVYRVDARKLPAYAGVTLASGDYAVYRVEAVSQVAEAADKGRRAEMVQGVERAAGALEFAGYLDDLRQRSKVKVSAPYAELIDAKANAKPAS